MNRLYRRDKQAIYNIKKSGILLDLDAVSKVFNVCDADGYFISPNHCFLCLNETPDFTYDFSDYSGDEYFFLCGECTDRLTGLSMEKIEEALTPISKGVSLRFKVLERDGFKCVYCGRNPTDDNIVLHVDHVFPKSKGGLDEMNNLVTACSDCNLGKKDRLIKVPKHIKDYLKDE